MDVQSVLATLGGYNILLAIIERSLVGLNLSSKVQLTPEDRTELDKAKGPLVILYGVLSELEALPSSPPAEEVRDLLFRGSIAKDPRILIGIQEVAPTSEQRRDLLEKLTPAYDLFNTPEKQTVDSQLYKEATNNLLHLLRALDQQTSEQRSQCQLMLRSSHPGVTPQLSPR